MVLKNDFVNMVRDSLNEQFEGEINFTRTDASKIIDVFTETISNACANNEGIRLHGIGDFVVKHYDAKVGRNPKTGEPVDIPETYKVKFKASKTLNEYVNQ